MADVAQIVFQVDASAVTRAVREFERLQKRINRLERQVGLLTGKLNRTRGAFERNARAVRTNSTAMTRYNSLIDAYILFEIGSYVINAADSFTILQNRIRLVTNGQAELNAVTQNLIDLAQDTRSSLNATTELYARVARSTEELGLSQKDVFEITELVNKSIQISGSTAKEAANGVIQFAQGLASSRLSGDEMRAVLEQMPRLARALADGLGVGIGRLRELGKEGVLTTDVVIEALRKAAPELRREFETIQVPIENAFEVFQTGVQTMIAAFDRGSGATAAFSDLLVSLGRTFRDAHDEAMRLGGTLTSSLSIAISIVAYNINKIILEIDLFQNTLSGLINSIVTFAQKAGQVILLGQGAFSNTDQFFAEIEKIEQQGEKVAEALAKQRAPIENSLTDLREDYESQLLLLIDVITKRRAEIEKIIAQGKGDISSGSNNAEGAKNVFDYLIDELESTAPNLEQIAQNAAKGIQQQFADFLFDPFGEGLDGMLLGFTNILRRMAAEAAAAKIFESFPFGKLFGALGGGGGGFISNPVPFAKTGNTLIDSFRGFETGGVIGSDARLSLIDGTRATGGPVSAGGTYLVGEKGPEVLTMGNQGGYITANKNIGTTFNLSSTVVVQGGGQTNVAAFQEALNERDKQLKAQIEAGIARKLRLGHA